MFSSLRAFRERESCDSQLVRLQVRLFSEGYHQKRIRTFRIWISDALESIVSGLDFWQKISALFQTFPNTQPQSPRSPWLGAMNWPVCWEEQFSVETFHSKLSMRIPFNISLLFDFRLSFSAYIKIRWLFERVWWQDVINQKIWSCFSRQKRNSSPLNQKLFVTYKLTNCKNCLLRNAS